MNKAYAAYNAGVKAAHRSRPHARNRFRDLRFANWYINRGRIPLDDFGGTQPKALRMISWRNLI